MQLFESCKTVGSIRTNFGTHVDSSGNGHSLKKISPLRPEGAFWGFSWSQIQKSGKGAQTAGTISAKFGTYADRTLKGHKLNNGPIRYQGSIFGGV